MQSPRVSIITPTYNHQKYIAACMQSVLNQSFQDWEQIIIDDGSTDSTKDIAQGCSDPRIHYVYQQNQGVFALAHTYNRALSLCRGSLIAILEGDDLWPCEKLAKMISAFDNPDVVVAYGAVGELSSDGTWGGNVTRAVRHRRKLPRCLLENNPTGAVTPYLLTQYDLVPPSTAIIRKSTLDGIGGFQYAPGLCVTDFPTFLRLSLEGQFFYTSEIMGFRRRHLESVTLNNMDAISSAAYQHAVDFVKQHNLRLTVSESEAIEKNWRAMQSSNQFAEGRRRLLQHDWHLARLHFKRAADLLQPHIFAGSALGWALSWLHSDLEWFIRLGGGAAIRGKVTSS